MNDQKLLSEYVDDKSDAAFAGLVERHLPLVYSAALRQTQDPALAENLVHVVFILLARKAGQLPLKLIVADWLFATTRQVIAISMGREYRRNRRESSRFIRQTSRPSDFWEQLLDGVLAHLGERERAAVLLHYFQFKRLEEVGLGLGISEEAAQQTLTEAIHKLHKLLLKQGVALPEPVLPGLLMTRGTQTPPSYLAPSVTAAALNQCALSTAVYALLQGAGHEPIWPRLKPQLCRMAKIAALVIVAGLLWQFWPRQTWDSPQGYTFDTRVVRRPVYVPIASLPELNDQPKVPTSLPARPASTNNVSVRPAQIGLAQPAQSSNTVWTPGGTVVELPPVPGGPASPLPTPAATPPQPDPLVQLPLWSASAGYSPVQNFVNFNVGLAPLLRTNLTPWATAQRSLIVVPPRPRPPGATKK